MIQPTMIHQLKLNKLTLAKRFTNSIEEAILKETDKLFNIIPDADIFYDNLVHQVGLKLSKGELITQNEQISRTHEFYDILGRLNTLTITVTFPIKDIKDTRNIGSPIYGVTLNIDYLKLNKNRAYRLIDNCGNDSIVVGETITRKEIYDIHLLHKRLKSINGSKTNVIDTLNEIEDGTIPSTLLSDGRIFKLKEKIKKGIVDVLVDDINGNLSIISNLNALIELGIQDNERLLKSLYESGDSNYKRKSELDLLTFSFNNTQLSLRANITSTISFTNKGEFKDILSTVNLEVFRDPPIERTFLNKLLSSNLENIEDVEKCFQTTKRSHYREEIKRFVINVLGNVESITPTDKNILY